jgi:hypothetical protein
MDDEAERSWLSSDDPLELLKALHPLRTLGSVQPQTRPSRLYLIACARRQWGRLPHACRVLVNLAESAAESPRRREPLRAAVAAVALELMHSDADPEDFTWAESALAEAGIGAELELACRAAGADAPPAHPLPALWYSLARLVYLPFEVTTPPYHWIDPELHSAELLREVYGNPYHVIPFAASWRTSTVMTLARQMYATGDFGAMPILADALQDAGCEDADTLDHCRGAAGHVRGCWVLDRVLQLR